MPSLVQEHSVRRVVRNQGDLRTRMTHPTQRNSICCGVNPSNWPFADLKEHRSLRRFTSHGLPLARAQAGAVVLVHNLVHLMRCVRWPDRKLLSDAFDELFDLVVCEVSPRLKQHFPELLLPLEAAWVADVAERAHAVD